MVRKLRPVPATTPGLSRAMFIRYGVLGTAGAVAAPTVLGATATAAFATDAPQPVDPQAPGAVLPGNRSGGIPAGPASHGFLAADIVNWSPATDPNAKHFVCHIPRAERIPAFAATQAHPTLDPATQLLMIDGDYRGSIFDERARAIGDEAYVYTFRYWQYLDVFSSWHGQLTPQVPEASVVDRNASGRTYGVLEIPDAGWTEAAHKNGARSIGCWFWPRNASFSDFVVKNADGSYPVADKMIEIRTYFGFDGYFLNQEGGVPSAEAQAFRDMMAYLKSKDPECYLQYYDAMLSDGELDYQNMINNKNVDWLGTPEKPLMDSIFMNYGWLRGWGTSGTNGPDPDLTRSAATVSALGFDPKKVAFGTTEFQQGGFNPSEIFGDLAHPGKKPPVSWGIFVPSELWNRGTQDGTTRTVYGRSLYRGLEQKFWSGPMGDPARSGRLSQPTTPYRSNIWNTAGFDGVAHSVVEKSPYASLPINTNFVIGVGASFTLAGEKVSDRPWNNAGIADTALSWQYWVDNATGSTDISLDESVVWEGAHSLKLQSAAAAESVLHLFKTDLTFAPTDTVSIAVKGSGTLPALSLLLTPRSQPTTAVRLPLKVTGSRNGWTILSAALGQVQGRVARVSLGVSGPAAFALNLGNVRLGSSPKPAKPQGFTVSARAAAKGAEVFFDWNLAGDAYAYDVFLIGSGEGKTWLGRCHRDCFFAEGISVPTSGRLNFTLEAIAKDGTRSAPAVTGIKL
ncbi:endo-beta-N-acetylglucosaminidase [Psychromicrobium xiongbiense]|uniref:endo-beta-N-acetylglucosaminidase n=1 Tax=Psychromicrobium xiongbiense TaxID=3051184 RepID=UPI002556A9C1|nr:hypothetical protein [Psychromicrobium sp. YIM S02556]